MIIYIVGYGRSGSTILSELLEQKLDACNLGEVKFLYRKEKDDLMHSYWKSFKKENSDILEERSGTLKKFDNLFGFLWWSQRSEFRKMWDEIFRRIGVDPDRDIIIDSSKTTVGSFMRGFYLRKNYEEVYFLYPARSIRGTVRSLLKGRNANIERGEKKGYLGRFLHTLFIGIPHLVQTKLFSQLYRVCGMEVIDLDNIESELDRFIRENGIEKSSTSKKVPMVYGNRCRI